MIEHLVRSIGWDWRVAITTLSAFPSRDVFVASLGTMYNAVDTKGEESLRSALINARTPKGHPAFTVYVVLSALVLSALCAQYSTTLFVIRHEAGAQGVYQVTKALGWQMVLLDCLSTHFFVAVKSTYLCGR